MNKCDWVVFILYYTAIYIIFLCILYRILCPTRPTVEDRNHTSRVVNHPFVANLKAGTAIMRTDKPNEVGGLHYVIVSFLPV